MTLNVAVVPGSVVIGANTYPIYGTTARAIEYFAARLDTTPWDGASSDLRSKSLVMGRRWLDRQSWKGELTSAVQETSFPRTGITDKEGNAVDPTLVPLGIEFAEYELALILLTDPAKYTNTNIKDNTKRLKAGEAEIEFFQNNTLLSEALFPDHILKLISAFLEGSGTTGLGVYIGGLCEKSGVSDYGSWGSSL